ncbi:MAG: hypothetical protein RMJ44_07250 [Cytophagales bacterium]|nr:hypothetical protein [Bernardetiaceae bacterium]MDW8210870.1 hypothetical protein [Cytophagales bacterium]
MKKLFENRFVEISLDEENAIIEMAWKEDAAYMLPEEFMEAFLKYAELVETYHPTAYLAYSKEGHGYTIPPEMQQWIAENIAPRTFKAGLTTTAIVLSNDLFVQLGAEEVFEEPETQVFQNRFFRDVEQARKWLKERSLAAKKVA